MPKGGIDILKGMKHLKIKITPSLLKNIVSIYVTNSGKSAAGSFELKPKTLHFSTQYAPWALFATDTLTKL